MFNIIKEVTIDYFERQIFISLIQFKEKTFIEIANRRERIALIRPPNLSQGRIILHEILPTIHRTKSYFEVVDLIQTSFKFMTYEESVFLIRTYKNKFSFRGIDMLCKIYKLKKEMHSGPLSIDGREYDLCYFVSFKNQNKPFGNFAGFFNENFIFIKREKSTPLD